MVGGTQTVREVGLQWHPDTPGSEWRELLNAKETSEGLMEAISSKCHKGDNQGTKFSICGPSAKLSSPPVFVQFHRNTSLLAR